MADTKSPDAFDDELLSAYVDGELEEDQRALVEQRLRDDPRAKQLADELQDLSATLRALPREQVGKELREGVLRQADEKMVSLAPRGDRLSSSRRWLWAAMAIAATLVLTIYQPEANEEEQQLAKAKPPAEGGSVPELRALAKSSSDESFSDSVAIPAEAELDAVESADTEIASEAAEEVFLIHLTLADAETGRQRFDELLASNRIDFETGSAEFEAPKDKSIEVRTDVLSSPENSSQPEVVLVEASPVQIESVLMACSSDTKNWNSLKFGNQTGASLPLSRWRRLERAGNKLSALSDSSEGKDVVAAVRALPATSKRSKERSSLGRNESNRLDRQKASTPRGRATRLGSDWNRSRGQLKAAKGLAPLIAVEESSEGDRDGAQQSNPQAQIRVVFVLHPAEFAGEPAAGFSGKKAVTGK